MQVGGFLGGFALIYTIVVAIVTFIINTVFAFAVDRDARRIVRGGGYTFLVAPGFWAFATFLGGPLVAVAYWLVHHSSLRADRDSRPSNNGGASA
jgi:membrane protein implicated in regulation of membrane protease activity